MRRRSSASWTSSRTTTTSRTSTRTSTSPSGCSRRSPGRNLTGRSCPTARLTCRREGIGHRSRDGELRVRHRPRKRRPPPGHRPRLVVDTGWRAPGAAIEDDLRRRGGPHRRARAGCGRHRGVLRRRRRPHRALRRTGARRGARRGGHARRGLHRIRAGPGQAGVLRLRARREGAGAAHGEGNPPSAGAADAEPRCRRARRRDLPRARAAAPQDGRMIARLRGKPLASTPEGLVLDVAGVGYLVAATPSALRKAEGAEEVVVETYLHVREDAMQLYGFAERAERELFVQLLSVNGIGPKVALAIVSGSPADELRRAIVREDAARFQAIPGIGKKTAERIVLELKEKLAPTPIAPVAAAALDDHVVARNALVELGYSLLDAERALAETDTDAAPEERVRQALRRFQTGRAA